MLTAEQARRLQKELGRQLDYLKRMRERINRQRWPHDDAIAVALEPAIEAVQRLQFRASMLPGDLSRYRFAPIDQQKSPPPV